MKHVCKHPERQGKPLRGVVAYLEDAVRATDIQVQRNKTVQLSFAVDGRPFRVTIGASSRGRNVVELAKRSIRHDLRLAGLSVPAGALA